MTLTVPFVLRCDISTLRRSTKGSITADIHVGLGTYTFPAPGWSDFVVIILRWWLEALYALTRGGESAELLFMDGPYLMVVTADASTCKIDCLENSKTPVSLRNASVDLVQLVQETEQVPAQVIEACGMRNWGATDVDALRNVLARSTSPKH
jgi:hypothetical protein